VAVADRLRYTRQIRDEMEQRGMAWTYWELAGGFGFYDPVAGAVRGDGLEQALFGP
jgi:endoglucanase